MGSNFDKFTEQARRVLSLALEEAQRLNHPRIGTEHLLLGLLREGDGVAARALTNMGLQLPKVRSAVEFIIGRGEGAVIGEIGLTPRARKAIELAVDEARRLDHSYIGTEHLLLGLVREGEGIAAGVLETFGLRPETIRRAVLEVLDEPIIPPSPKAPSASKAEPPARAKEPSDDNDVALLLIALRLARKRDDREAASRIMAALDSAELRYFVGRRINATERLVDAERARIELMVNIANIEREIEEYDDRISRIRADFARRSEEEPPDSGVGVRPRR